LYFKKEKHKHAFYFFTVCLSFTLKDDNAIFIFCCFRNNFYPIFPPTKDPNTAEDIPLLGPEGAAGPTCPKIPLTDIRNG
jgi:hypothetical protein